jgi:glycosyltransferase involved in cell wall biosynthesis
VIQLHQLSSRREEHALALAQSPYHRWLHRRELTKARTTEAWITKSYDLVCVVSKEDARALPGKSLAIPNGVDLGRFRATPLPSEPRLLITGTWSWPPNVDGLAWFCGEVLPRVRDAIPEVSLAAVGRSPGPQVMGLVGAGVTVHPDVPSVVPYIERSRVCLAPIRIGSGTRIKALEALASGRPLVGTSVGLEGLGIRQGVEAMVADTPGAMAAAIIQLLMDDGLAANMATAARILAERYSWLDIAQEFADAVVGGEAPIT